MSSIIRRIAQSLSLFAVVASTAYAATPKVYHPKISVGPTARIVDKIDNTKLTVLPGSHARVVDGLPDMGRASASTPLSHMMLVLKPTDEQEFALHSLLDQQQDKNHENYHQWMTPETFGAYFGVAQADIAKVSSWLQDSGFTIDAVAKGGRIITFSGTVAQVESAFHTEIHNYSVNGEMHMSNNADISIPTALSSVVLGPNRLSDFKPHSDAKGYNVKTDGKGNVLSAVPVKGAHPLTSGNPQAPYFTNGEFVGGADLGYIYNAQPLFAKGIQGQGQTLGIIGQTDVELSDIQIYRYLFGLPANNYTRVQIGTDPGYIADDSESDLDLEISGAMAPLANQIFYTSGNSYFGGGIDSSAEYVIEDNAADIFSTSYGECEGDLLAAGNAFYNFIYEQGAAQGQSIFISTGDDGPDTCGTYFNPARPAYSTTGYTVNGLGSTPYNVAVGGTIFNEGSSYNTQGATPYWGTYTTGVPFENAKGFIPDQPWNESTFGSPDNLYGGLTAGGSGISFYYATPSWQVGPGVPTTDPAPPTGSYEASIPAYGATGSPFVVPGPHRYMPDVALNANVLHDGTIVCSEGSCELGPGGAFSFSDYGGTSVASPTMAGAQALINQVNGGRQGNPNYYYYRAAAAQAASTNTVTNKGAACVAATYVEISAPGGCSFHDSQAGNTFVPGSSGSTVNEIGWKAGPGYDLAVGLDSPDVANLANTWSTINFNASTTSFTISPTSGNPGDIYNISVTVAPAATGVSLVPTGDVAIIAQALYGGLGWITLSGGTGTAQFSGLPGGTYCIYAHYAGDVNFGGSNSPCTTVTISTSTPTVGAASYSLSTRGALVATSTFAYGTNVYIEMGVLPAGTGYGIPTGTFTLDLANGCSTPNCLPPYTTPLDPNGATIGTTFYPAGGYFDAGLGYAGYDIASTYPVLAPGTYTANVAYSGDTTFTSANAPPFQFTVGPISQTLTLTTGTPYVTAGTAGSATLYASMATIDPTVGGVPPAGTVTLTDVTTGATCGTGTFISPLVTSSTVTITNTCTLAAGANSIIATFAGTLGAAGGSAYYNGVVSSAVTVTVGAGTATTTTITPQATTYQVLNTIPLVATVPQATSGTVTFYLGGREIGTATVGSTHTATLNYALMPAGANAITATYGGVSSGSPAVVLDASTAPAVTYTVAKNTPSIVMSATNTGNQGTGYAENVVPTFSPAATGKINQAIAPNPTINYLDAANGGAATVIGTSNLAYYPGGDYDANFQTTALVPGHHVLSAVFVGDANYASATSNSLTVNLGITTLTITSNTGGNVGVGIPFTLTGTVTPVLATTTPIGGTITFYDGPVSAGVVIGTASVVNGVGTTNAAAFTTISTHTINAVYSGDANFYTSSATLPYTVVTETPGYVLSVSPSSIILPHNGYVVVQLTATVFGNYAGIGSLYCTGLPANVFCPQNAYQQFTFSGADGPITVPVTITAINAQGTATPVKASFLWIPALFLGLLLVVRRKQITGMSRNLIALTILFCGMMATNGCSGGNDYSQYTTPTGKYTVTLNSLGTCSNCSAGNPVTPYIPTTTLQVTVQ